MKNRNWGKLYRIVRLWPYPFMGYIAICAIGDTGKWWYAMAMAALAGWMHGLAEKNVPCSNWMAIEDGLPPEDVDVLVCEKSYDEKETYISTLATWGNQFGDAKRPKEWRVVANCGGYECEPNDCRPTHWMSLPSLPNNPDQQRRIGDTK